MNKLLRFVAGGFSVIAGHADLHTIRDQLAFELLHALGNRSGHVGCIRARFFCNRQRDRRCRARLRASPPCRRTVPDVAAGNVAACFNRGHVRQQQRLAVLAADDQIGHLFGIGQIAARRHRHCTFVGIDALTGLMHQIGRLQGLRKVIGGHAVGGQLGGVQRDQHTAIGCADGVHVAGAGNTFEIGLQRMRHFRQPRGIGVWLITPQGQRHHRHVINAFGLDDGCANTGALRQEVGIGKYLVVQPHQGRLARDAHIELHRQHRHAGPADRIHVLDAFDFGQFLF